METQQEVACPKCGGAMWDQKNGKFPWKAGTPIYKCRDKDCAKTGGVIWEPKKPLSEGPLLPNETASDPHLQTQPVPQQATKSGPTVEQYQRCYLDCLRWAIDHVKPMLLAADDLGCTPEAILAATATLFIARTRR